MNSHYFIKISSNTDSAFIGNKGKTLQILSNNHFNIPKTYFITTKAYECFIKKNGIKQIIDVALQGKHLNHKSKSETIVNAILSKNIPQKILNELIDCKLFNGSDLKWAIRSSSNLEDLPGASFAGLYDSYLNVTGLDNIIKAIKKCWASLWNERAIVYREDKNLNHIESKMSVVIQQMVNAEFAGVLFTREPGSNNRKDMFLEYCEGLSDRLVSGKITPYSCRINTALNRITYLNSPEQTKFKEIRINHLVSEAIKIEKHFGVPQDIEWAFDGKDFYFLQSRPIITTERLISDNKIWTRANIGEVLPDPITPLTWDVFRATLMNNPEVVLNQTGSSAKIDAGIKLINGRGYLQLEHFLNSFCYLPFITPEIMGKVLGVQLPLDKLSYSRPKGFLVRLAQITFLLNSSGLFLRLSRLVKKLPPIPSKTTADLEEIIVWNTKCFHLHLKCTAYTIGAFGLLSYLLNRWLPNEVETLLPEIMIGQENLQTAVQGISLWKMAEYVRTNSKLLNSFKIDTSMTHIDELLMNIEQDDEFKKMVQSFLDANGARAAGEFELSVPRWHEDPTFVLNVIGRFLNSQSKIIAFKDPLVRRQQHQQIINEVKNTLGLFNQKIFIRLLDFYSECTTMRENMKYRLMEGYDLLRSYFLTIGKEFTKKGIMLEESDIFFLKSSEIFSLNTKSKSFPNQNELILKRKAQHEKWKAKKTPNLIIDGMSEVKRTDKNVLSGIGCSPGVAEGTARVLYDISEVNLLRPGEILVAPHTDPGWTPLFLSCKAVVTEIGGFLSHGATVAREYGIPAVVNVSGITQLVNTGDVIKVDGTKGVVTICASKN